MSTLLISDIDGVLCDSVSAALRWVWDRYRVVVPYARITRYEMEFPIAAVLCEAGVQVDPERVAEELTNLCWRNPAHYHLSRPDFDVWHALQRWQSSGRPLQFATRREPHLRHVTAGWLTDHGFDIDQDGRELPGGEPLVMSANKIELAQRACDRHDRVVFIEDALHYATPVAAQTEAEVWVPAQPWNDAPLPQRASRLKSYEIARCLLAL
jgi:hypothetical protein